MCDSYSSTSTAIEATDALLVARDPHSLTLKSPESKYERLLVVGYQKGSLVQQIVFIQNFDENSKIHAKREQKNSRSFVHFRRQDGEHVTTTVRIESKSQPVLIHSWYHPTHHHLRSRRQPPQLHHRNENKGNPKI